MKISQMKSRISKIKCSSKASKKMSNKVSEHSTVPLWNSNFSWSRVAVIRGSKRVQTTVKLFGREKKRIIRAFALPMRSAKDQTRGQACANSAVTSLHFFLPFAEGSFAVFIFFFLPNPSHRCVSQSLPGSETSGSIERQTVARRRFNPFYPILRLNAISRSVTTRPYDYMHSRLKPVVFSILPIKLSFIVTCRVNVFVGFHSSAGAR